MITSQIPKTNIPAEMQSKLIALIGTGQQFETLRNELKLEEARIAVAVSDEKGEGGKPLFSNDKARDAETFRRVQESGECAEIRSNIFGLEFQRGTVTAEIDALKMNFKIYLLDREFEIAVLNNQRK